MVYIIFSLISLFITRKDQHSILRYLFFLLLASVVSAFLCGRLQEEPSSNLIYHLYMATVLCILFWSWKSYCNLKGADFSDVYESRIEKYEPIIKWLNLFVFVLDLYIFINVFELLVAGMITVAEHKNEGGAADVFAALVPKVLITLSNLLNPFALISLVFHFYYLIKKDLKKSLLHLFLSFGSVLSGLMALSRANIINYALTYLGLYLFLLPLFSAKLVNKVKVAMFIVFALIAMVFMALTSSRFSDYEEQHKEAIIRADNYPQLSSMMNYYSQWINAAPIILEKYKPEYKAWGMYNSFGLGVQIMRSTMGTEAANQKREQVIYRVLGADASAFHGVVARCVYDFGYIGTVIFILINGWFIKRFKPRQGQLSFITLIGMPVLLMFCLGFFSGNIYSSLSVDLSIIYMYIFYLLIRRKNITQ